MPETTYTFQIPSGDFTAKLLQLGREMVDDDRVVFRAVHKRLIQKTLRDEPAMMDESELRELLGEAFSTFVSSTRDKFLESGLMLEVA